MDDNTIYLIVAGLAAILIAVAFALRQGPFRERLSPVAGLAVALVVAGVVFGDSRYLGYGFIAIGMLLAIIDLLRTRQGRGESG